MNVKTYGKSDEDLAAETLLRSLTKDLKVQYYILHPRIPIDARPCKLPDSLTVQARLMDGSFITVRQDGKGKPPRQLG